MMNLIKHVTYKGRVSGVQYDRKGVHIRLYRVEVEDKINCKKYELDSVAVNVSYENVDVSTIRSLLKKDKVYITVKTVSHPNEGPCAYVEEIINKSLEGIAEVVNAENIHL